MNRHCVKDTHCAALMLACLLLGIALGWIIAKATREAPRPAPAPAALYFRISPSTGVPKPDNSPRA